MNCPSCGNQIDPNWRICAFCGSTLEMAPEPLSALLSAAVTLPARHDEKPSAPTTAIHGREEEMDHILKILARGLTVLLAGPAGIGKTTLAQEAAYRLLEWRACRSGVLWLEDIGQAPLAAICDALARAMGDDEIPRQAPERKPELVLEMLADCELLVVLDGIAEPDTLGEFLYRCLPPMMPVLATSSQQSDRWSLVLDSSYSSTLVLRPLVLEAALALFRERSGLAGDDGPVAEVCHLLQGHPLALALAAAVVSGDAGRLAQMPGRLAETKAELGPPAEAQIALAPLSCSYQDLDNGQRDCFRWLVAGFDGSMGREFLGEISSLEPSTCQGHMEELARLGLAMRQGARAAVTPAVRGLGRELLGTELPSLQDEVLAGVARYAAARVEHTEPNREGLMAELGGLMGGLRYAADGAKWDKAVGLADGLCWALETAGYWTELVTTSHLGIHAAQHLGNLEVVGRLARAAANVYKEQGNRMEARRLLDLSLEASEQIGDVASSAVIDQQIGSIAQEQGDFAGSLAYFKRGLEASKDADDRTSMADNLHEMGITAYQQGEYGQAETYYLEALDIRREVLGPDHPQVAEVLNNLALLRQEQGDYAEAQSLYQEALRIHRAARAEDGPEVASILHNMAGLYRTTGAYDEAETLYRQALKIRRETLKPDDPAVAQTLNDLAGLYITLGRFPEAATVQQQAVEIARGTVGERHPYFVEMVRNLAGLYYLAGDLQLSQRLYMQVLERQRATLGTEHPDVAETMNNLALVYQAMGAYEDCESLYDEALQVCQTTLREDHPLSATITGNLAGLFEATERYPEAENLYKQALEMRRSAYGEKHPDVAQALANLASFYEDEGDYGQAQELWQEATEIYRATMGEESPFVAEALHHLGALYETAGDPAQAESCYREAITIYGHTLGETHPDTAAAALSLAEFYYAAKKYADAEPFYRQALAYYQDADETGERRALISYSLGVIARAQEAYPEARGRFEESLEIKVALGEPAGIASTYSQLGQTAQQAGQLDQAFEYYEEAIQISRQIGDRRREARTLHQLGTVAQAQGEPAKAREYYEESLEISQKLNMQSDVASTMQQLSLLARETGEAEQAASLDKQSETIYESLDWSALLRRYLSREATEDDLRAVSLSFGIDYDDLPGQGTVAKASELVIAAYRENRLGELAKITREKLPDLPPSPEAQTW